MRRFEWLPAGEFPIAAPCSCKDHVRAMSMITAPDNEFSRDIEAATAR
jgi:hypothetical protein